ncbi:hypothetical protein ACSBR1_018022 [Camellia fascicularis]
METKKLVSVVLGSDGNTNSSILNEERGNELSDLSGSYGAFSPKSLKLSKKELETLVVLAKNSETKVKRVTAKSIQEIFDHHQTSRPSVNSTLADLSTPLFQSAKWSDRVEGEQRSKFLDLPDSVEVTKTRAIAHLHGAIVEKIEKSSTPHFVSKEIRIPDMGDQVLGADESGTDGSPRGIEIQNDPLSKESGPNPTGFEGNTHGGFQSRGRGTNTNNRGCRGGRGQYRAPEGRSWANVASTSVRSEVSFNYYPPKLDQGKIVVEMPPSSPMAKWEACLVGYFIDKNLPYTLIKNNAFNMWKNKGLVDILKNDDGFIFFMFENRDCCIDVLEGEPWYVGGFLLILKQWHRMMKLSKEDKKSIPIWVKFYNIPLEYWDRDGLSRISSAVGIPLFMDQLTSSGSRISFARVCVDIPVDSAFPDNFVITSGDVSINIHVEYQGVPSRCVHCHKNTEDRVESDEGWTKVKDKGKRKVGEQSPPDHTDPTEAISSSAEMRDALVTDFHSEGAVLHSEVVEIAANATDQVAAFHSEVVEIAKIINPAAEEFIKSIKHAEKEDVRATSLEMQGGKEDGGIKVGSSTKHKSSGRTSGSQKKKKSVFVIYIMSIKLSFWNVRGFNNPSKYKEVVDFVKQEDIKIMSILETKIKMENEAKLFENSFKNWKFLSNSQPDLPARIWICWDPNFCDIMLVQKSNQFIFVKVTVFYSDFSFFSTFVYAENKHDLRLPLFCDLQKIAINHTSHPSIFLGDFNAVRFSYEKIWGGGEEGLE